MKNNLYVVILVAVIASIIVSVATISLTGNVIKVGPSTSTSAQYVYNTSETYRMVDVDKRLSSLYSKTEVYNKSEVEGRLAFYNDSQRNDTFFNVALNYYNKVEIDAKLAALSDRLDLLESSSNAPSTSLFSFIKNPVRNSLQIVSPNATVDILYGNFSKGFVGVGFADDGLLATSISSNLLYVQINNSNSVNSRFVVSYQNGTNTESLILYVRVIDSNGQNVSQIYNAANSQLITQLVTGDTTHLGNSIFLTAKRVYFNHFTGDKGVEFTAGPNVKFDRVFDKNGNYVLLPVNNVNVVLPTASYTVKVYTLAGKVDSSYTASFDSITKNVTVQRV